jgi:polar amino acid transport system substrate-binding protein
MRRFPARCPALLTFAIALILMGACSASDRAPVPAPGSEPAPRRSAIEDEFMNSKPLVIAYGQEAYTSLLLRNLILEAYDEAGIPVEFRLIPAGESLGLLSRGEIDGDLARIPVVVKGYEHIVQVPALVHNLEMVIITADDHPPVSGLEDLRRERLGFVENSRILVSMTEGYRRQMYADISQVVQALLDAQIDAAIVERYNARYELLRTGAKNLVVHEPPVSVSDLYHYLHEDHAELVPRLTAAIEGLHAGGDYLSIVEMTNDYLLSGE